MKPHNLSKDNRAGLLRCAKRRGSEMHHFRIAVNKHQQGVVSPSVLGSATMACKDMLSHGTSGTSKGSKTPGTYQIEPCFTGKKRWIEREPQGL